METPKIETDVPIPETGNTVYHWERMEVGNSYFFKAKPDEIKLVYSRVAGSARIWGRRHGAKFSLRKYPDGVRIWRTA